MKAAVFDYLRPASVDDAVDALAAGGAGSRLIAGSQSLGPMLNLRLARPDRVIDTSRLPELRSVRRDGDTLVIGAAVTHAQIEDEAFAELRGTPLAAVAGGIAYRAIRTRGTLGGSLAHADPAADWLLVMVALGAELVLRSAAGERRLPAPDFALGAYATALRAGEMIVAVRLPAFGAGARWMYRKFCRKPGEFAHASCAAIVDAGRSRLAIGALDGAPRLLPALAARLPGWIADPPDLAAGSAAHREIIAAIDGAAPGCDAIERHLHAENARRCVQALLTGEA